MNKARLFNCAALLIAVSMSMQTAVPVEARELEMPRTFQHEGLIFSQGLTLSATPETPLQPLSLQFKSHSKLEIKKATKPIVHAEAIITLIPKIRSVAAAKTVTHTPTPTPTQIPTPTSTPTPIAGSSATPNPTTPAPIAVPTTLVQSSNTGGLDAEKLFAMSNAHRQAMGLPPFQKDEQSCQLASSRAPEVAGEVASGALHAGLASRNLNYWNTENIIQMRTEEEAFHWWINHDIHRRAIEGNFTYSCAACSGNNCAQEFTNYQPK